MPLYRSDNLQGASDEEGIFLPVGQEVLLLEWGHFIEQPLNLLMVNGSLEMNNSSTFDGRINIILTMDNNVISSRRVDVPVLQFAHASVGARLQNVPVGHHVFKLLAISNFTGTTVFALARDATSISGQAQ